ncbi:hypothetical protein [Spirillospora sp. CA-294931]|uniref:hypothetical protein n=1 Tax=Spirillospora sp. CA-294931 TaxID=3240042 RepID=UPI003D8B5603
MTAVQQAPTPQPPAARTKAPSKAARLMPSTVASRVRALTAGVAVALVALIAVTWVAVGNARDGVRVIGHDAGPQVVATGDLYFQLTDMDAQLANALLIGRTPGLGGGRDQALKRYEEDRKRAGKALLQAAKLADEDAEEQTARTVLDALARYERVAGQALMTDQQSGHTAGPPPQRVTVLYRQATDLMKLDLLPKAYNLTLDNGTLVRHTYESERDAVIDGRTWVLVTGLILLAGLVGLQLFLAHRFRRLLNPALALATLVTLVLVAAGTSMLSGQANHLKDAKEDGFDSILALARARAISNSANADQTRFLLDPGRADTYEQVFMSKSQSVLYLRADNLSAYNQKVQARLGGAAGTSSSAGGERILGLLGAEADRSDLRGQDDALRAVLARYRTFQQDDFTLREMVAAGRRSEAIELRMGDADRDFRAYDASMLKLIGIHRAAFDKAVDAGDDGSSGWNVILPVGGLVILALLLVGVRPRLAEYR